MIQNQKGQMVVESLLIMVLSVSLLIVATKFIKDKEVISHLIAGPWDKTASMIESGTWSANPQIARNMHPNRGTRARVLKE